MEICFKRILDLNNSLGLKKVFHRYLLVILTMFWK